MINDLLSALEEERTAFLIAEGNLRREKAKPEFIPQWTSNGYVARNEHYRCTCGYDYDHILGAFHKETAATGQVRYTQLGRGFQLPLGQNFPVETTEHLCYICPACLTSKGFSHV